MNVLIAYLLGILTGIKQIHSVNKAKKSKDQSGDSLPVLRAELDIPPTVEALRNPRAIKKMALSSIWLLFIPPPCSLSSGMRV